MMMFKAPDKPYRVAFVADFVQRLACRWRKEFLRHWGQLIGSISFRGADNFRSSNGLTLKGLRPFKGPRMAAPGGEACCARAHTQPNNYIISIINLLLTFSPLRDHYRESGTTWHFAHEYSDHAGWLTVSAASLDPMQDFYWAPHTIYVNYIYDIPSTRGLTIRVTSGIECFEHGTLPTAGHVIRRWHPCGICFIFTYILMLFSVYSEFNFAYSRAQAGWILIWLY